MNTSKSKHASEGYTKRVMCRMAPLKRALLIALVSVCMSVIPIVSIDVLNDGPCTKLLANLLDYALPVMNDPDIGKNTKDLVISRGFEFESHEVVTKDGYIIEFHRIFNKNIPRGLPVLMGLPLFCSSTVLLSDFRNNTGAYLFADAGYDVWITNVRGNRFGRRHLILDPVKDKLQFYNFTFLDIGEFDLAAQIDYVIKTTGQRKVHFVGTSQGAAAFFALLSKQPSFNSKIHSMASYGGFRSICYTQNKGVTTFSHLTWPLSEIILRIESLAAIWTYLSPVDAICTRIPYICGSLVIALGFKHEHYLNLSRFAVYMEHMPAGTSLKNIVYYGQTRSKNCDGTIRDFDYDMGPLTELMIALGLQNSKNEEIYGSREPPIIDFSNIKVPMKLYYSDGDDFVPREETMKLAKAIGVSSVNVHRIDDPRFTHVNYVFNKQRNDFVLHTINFFRGINTSWPLGKTEVETLTRNFIR